MTARVRRGLSAAASLALVAAGAILTGPVAQAAVGDVTEYAIPTPSSFPFGIAAGRDGNVWFTEDIGNKVGKITKSGAITEYPIPTAGSNPIGITAGPDGKIWFTESGTNKVASVTSSGVITEYTIPGPYSKPVSIVA